MSRVFPVDQAMLKRTTEWLLSRRDGKGGFKRSSTALDEFGGAPADTTNAYIVWALTEAGIAVEKELDAIVKQAQDQGMKDSYLVALVTASLFKVGRLDEAKKFARRLVELQKEEGQIEDAVSTITWYIYF